MTVAAFDPLLVDFASEVGESGPVAVEGLRSRWSVGGLPAGGTRIVNAPAGIVEYKPEEMTLRVRAGTPLEELHAELQERGQGTALPRRRGTVGGAVAVGENDISVMQHGRLRDCVLQVVYVSDGGRLVRGGGPTVKNVSGFDLPRLMVGSLGTLGLLVEVLLRTNPSPRMSVLMVSRDADPFASADALTRPSSVLWDGARTYVEIEGHPEDVRSEISLLDPHGTWAEAEGWPELPAYRWSLSPADLHGLDTAKLGRFVASIGVGTVFADEPQPPASPSPALASLHARVKSQFDPAGRLNPGRIALRRQA
jgi:glycolate oxidase FAD binding subunit